MSRTPSVISVTERPFTLLIEFMIACDEGDTFVIFEFSTIMCLINDSTVSLLKNSMETKRCDKMSMGSL